MRRWVAVAAGLSLFATDAAAYSSIDFGNLEDGVRLTSRDDGLFAYTEEVQTGTVLVSGVPTKRVRTVDGIYIGDESYLTNDALGFRLHREAYPPPDSDEFLFTTPAVALPGTFTLGQVFGQNDAAVSYIFPGFGTFPMLYDSSAQVIGIETVIVPAGTFTAVRVDNDFTIFGTIDGEFVSTGGPASDWYVRNLGVVKSAGSVDGEPFVTELMSHNVALCGDLTQDGVVAASDVALYRSALAGAATLTATQLGRCTTIAPQGPCDVRDLAVLRREVFGPLLAPGISRACKTP